MELDLPHEYEGIKLYKYHFYGMDKPIVIEAFTKVQAREILNGVIEKIPEQYRKQKPYGESVQVPIKGITTKKIKDKTFIWVGLQKSRDGWMEQEEYNAKLKEYAERESTKQSTSKKS